MQNTPVHHFLEQIQALYQDRYVSASDLADFLAKYPPPDLRAFRRKARRALFGGHFRQFYNLHKTLRLLDSYLHARDKHNQAFIRQAKRQTFSLNETKLDKHQIAAVVASEDATLILAPAGSGKTATLLAKVDYLMRHDHIPPERILVIAFTNKVVAELKDRLQNDQVEIRTFHSFGNKIIKASYPAHRLISEEASLALLQQILQRLLKNQSYAAQYHDFLHGEADLHPFIQVPTMQPEAFEELITSAISLQKSERLDLKSLKARVDNIPDEPKRRSATKLFCLYAPIYQAYEAYLESHQLYDFADMLNLSTDHIRRLPAGSLPYDYILVDEAQDLSESKSMLLKATLDKCARVKLFAVGDDWQSIYRFAGSNLQVLDDFEQIFGRPTYRGLIELTYRFGQPTAKISNRFVTKNPHQSRKRVTPAIKKYTPIEFALYDTPKSSGKLSPPPDYTAVDQTLQALFQEHGAKLFDYSLQIISRFNRDVYRIAGEGKRYKNVTYDAKNSTFLWRLPGSAKKLAVPFCTIHKAKGITRDIVFVINLNEGSMPATRDGNPLLETMLAEMDDYPFAEERRLFYVAITRAKLRTFLVADRQHLSPFLLELDPKLKSRSDY